MGKRAVRTLFIKNIVPPAYPPYAEPLEQHNNFLA
ncbi:hypothetical protein BGP_6446 [Beggiatoa sp. PS]|nr:hypothetical protein BGP_6446 [Beggiatoa sp. PS]